MTERNNNRSHNDNNNNSRQQVPIDDEENIISDEKLSPFRVLGIALIVDQIGKGPRMVLRYPTASASTSDSRKNTLLSSTDRNILGGLVTTSNTAAGTTSNTTSTSLGGGGGTTTTTDRIHKTTSQQHHVIEEDLFFRLPPRQMAKLFRPKPSLCGQPMTLSVGGTVFCCCAILLHDDNNNIETENTNQQLSSSNLTDLSYNNKNDLVLFSVVIALTPQIKSQSIPVSGWMENSSSINFIDEIQHIQSFSTIEGKLSSPSLNSKSGKASASFLCIRRVHVTLSRLCRILEREEKRCRYVSLQSDHFDTIRHNIHQRRRDGSSGRNTNTEDDIINGVNNITNTFPSGHVTSPNSSSSVKGPQQQQNVTNDRTNFVTPPVGGNHHRRATFTASDRIDIHKQLSSEIQILFNENDEKQKLLEQEQEILETMMVASPTFIVDDIDNNGSIIEHQGNLARELIQVYHALSRNDHDFPPTPSILLSGRDSIVYINRHIAVAVESVAHNKNYIHSWSSIIDNNNNNKPNIQPFYTILFPNVSPIQLLDAMSISQQRTIITPCHLQQILQVIHPSKTLINISIDSNLSLEITIDIITYLIIQGVCLPSLIITKKSYLTCNNNIKKIYDLSLSFAQEFGTLITLFSLISFLTTTTTNSNHVTLGESMITLATSNDTNIICLRESIEASCPFYQKTFYGNNKLGSSIGVSTTLHEIYNDDNDNDLDIQVEPIERINISERRDEMLYQMVVWLCSRMALVQLVEYMVADGNIDDYIEKSSVEGDTSTPIQFSNNLHKTEQQGSKIVNSRHRNELLNDNQLLRDLWDADCLTGKISVQACSWRLGIEVTKLTSFIRRCPCIRLIIRVPSKGDNWESV